MLVEKAQTVKESMLRKEIGRKHKEKVCAFLINSGKWTSSQLYMAAVCKLLHWSRNEEKKKFSISIKTSYFLYLFSMAYGESTFLLAVLSPCDWTRQVGMLSLHSGQILYSCGQELFLFLHTYCHIGLPILSIECISNKRILTWCFRKMRIVL